MVPLAILLSSMLGCRLQDALLYYPEPRDYPAAARIARASGLAPWPVEGPAYRGWIAAIPPPTTRGTVVVLHGNAGAAAHRGHYVAALQPLGLQVVLAEYPGYGGRAGKPGEAAFAADALETTRMARQRFGGPLYLWGESLGAAVIAAAMAEDPGAADGLALITPWDRLENAARVHFPGFLVRWALRDTYDSLTQLKRYQRPVAVLLAGRDRIVPAPMGFNLYRSLHTPKKLWVFPDVGHNDWPASPTARWWRQVIEFLETAAPAP